MTADDLARPVPAELLRFNPGDFAPHNILLRPASGLCAIDFEYFGPEEAAALPVSFLAAEQSGGLSAAQTASFLSAYHAAHDLPDSAFERYDRLRALFEINWVLVNLSLMTPVHVQRKRFAGDFDLGTHLASRRAMLLARLEHAERLVAALR
jgi:Ser/Thr protein kinase RdoA (MazF antagonist)